MAALDHPCNDIVAPETDGPLQLQEDLCRCEHRRPLPADHDEDSRPQPPRTPSSGSWKVARRVVRSLARAPLILRSRYPRQTIRRRSAARSGR